MLRLAAISVRNYAKKVLGSGGSSTPSLQSQRIRHEAETNPVKLATYCCGSNIKQTGEDVKLGADEDYPDWLWKMHLGRPLDPKDLDPNTEEYWERLQKLNVQRLGRLRAKELKPEIRINMKKQLAITESLVHRALAYKYYDAGKDNNAYDKEIHRKYGPIALAERKSKRANQ